MGGNGLLPGKLLEYYHLKTRMCKTALFPETRTSEATSTSVSSHRDWESSRSSLFPASITYDGKDILLVRFTYFTWGYYQRAEKTKELPLKVHMLPPSLPLSKEIQLKHEIKNMVLYTPTTQRVTKYLLYSDGRGRPNLWLKKNNKTVFE